MSAASLLLQAVHARLSGDAALTALAGPDAVRDRLLERPRLPAILLDEIVSEDTSTDADRSEEHRLTLEIWTGEGGRKQAQAMTVRIRALLHDAALTWPGLTLVNLRHVSTLSRRAPKTRNHIAQMRFRAVTE